LELTDRPYQQADLQFFTSKLPLLDSVVFEIFTPDSLPDSTQQELPLAFPLDEGELFSWKPTDTPATLRLKAFSLMS